MSETLPRSDDAQPAPTQVDNPAPGEPNHASDASAAAPASEPGGAAKPSIPELSPAACAARLGELFPALFGRGAQPLKLRIQADIQARAPGVFTRKSLSAFLHRYTTGTAYLMAITQAAQRVDLDGAPAGEIAEEHRVAAREELARRRTLFEARRAAENGARRAAEDAARQANAAAEQARRERAGVLRAFETSTLTRANFCALKGLVEADLDTLLATARQEAAQRAQAPREDVRPQGRRDGARDAHRGRGDPRNQGPRDPR
jgi:ProP effector